MGRLRNSGLNAICLAGAYGKSPGETLEVCREASRPLPAGWKGEFNCNIRLGMGLPRSQTELRAIVGAVRDGGCRGVGFFNLSESPPKMLDWIKGAVRGI
jgi:hypothetical protein